MADTNTTEQEPRSGLSDLTVKLGVRDAAKNLIDALDANLFQNDYCGLESSKKMAPKILTAIESLRSILNETPNE